jgi:hypothetical protein
MSPETLDEWIGLGMIVAGIAMVIVGMWRDLRRGGGLGE